MATEKKTILTDKEHLIAAALGIIGIALPESYIIRVAHLVGVVKTKGLENVTIRDAVHITSVSDAEYNARLKNAE